MARDRIPLRIAFLMFLGFIIALVLITTVSAFWRHNFREGLLLLTLGTGLTLLFFRRRLFPLLIMVITSIFVLTTMGAISHRSTAGAFLALAVAACGYLLVWWDVKKHPDRAFGDWKDLFD